MSRLKVYGVTCVLFLASFAAHATTIVLPTDEQLIAKSPLIVDGTVNDTRVVEINGAIWTETVVSVGRAIKGSSDSTITVREPGGVHGDRITKIFGTPEFEAGERVLLFLEEAPQGGYRTIDLYVGKFTEARMLDGRRLWTRMDHEQDVTLLDADLNPMKARNVQRDAVGFEQFVYDRSAGRTGKKNYGIENPVLSRDVEDANSMPSRIAADFTLISEPTIYRWFRFDSGQSAQWYSGGSQPGYSNGGVTELQTGMSSWTGYSGAKIYYSYAGSRSGSFGGLNSSNGVNEVLFNDPLGEISGTYSKTAGGVVGTGGFNGVSSQQSWTAPFAADSSHSAGTKQAWNITEGNLTIQDGVSAANGISSTRLSEIIAHEFGHTLGFGHSSSSTALMYYTLTGIGPSLRDDDQLAARWLYPNGGSTPPPPPTPQAPAAPSDFRATASGTSINLSWNDNASNETAQSIYLAAGNGSFSKVADFGANIESAKLSGVSAGSYSLYVVASNAAGTSKSNTVTVTISAAPVAKFSMTPQTGTAGVTTFTFYDESTGSIATRTWNFGDGSSSGAAVATHVYDSAGQYTITLTVSNGSSSSQTSETINVSGSLASSFTYSPSNPTINDTVHFTDQSAGAPTSWAWTFGDGGTSSQQNPSRRYSSPGTYTAKLTVYRGALSSSSTRTVVVGSSAPVTPSVNAAFGASSLNVGVGSAVSFTDQSTGSPTQWSWSFGDGGTSSSRNPSHSWSAPGTYTVSLFASNATSSSSTSRQVTVAQPATQDYRALVSVATQTSGVNGTSWRTELNVFNAGSQGASLNMIFIPAAGGSVMTRSAFLSPRQSLTYSNALLDLFGIGSGAGALAIEASSAASSADLRVTSRTFTSGLAGTYGQAVPDVRAANLERTLFITGMAASSSFRTNVGLVNRGITPMSATLTLFNKNGGVLSSKNVTIPANSFQQSPLGGLFPELSGSHDALTMRIASASGDAVTAYASVVDNATQDPIYIQASPAVTGASMTIPVVGRSPGANGTFWRSDVTLFNPNSGQMTATLRYGGMSRLVTIPSASTRVVADVLSLFGQTSGSGRLEVTWTSGSGPIVTSRTYTSVQSGGTYGQSIDPVDTFGSRLFVPGLRNDSSYRSNLGFVNGGSQTEVVTAILLSAFGSELGRATVSLAPGQQSQYSVAALFGNVSLPAGFTLQVDGDSNSKIFAYASMVDNGSGDPVFFAGR